MKRDTVREGSLFTIAFWREYSCIVTKRESSETEALVECDEREEVIHNIHIDRHKYPPSAASAPASLTHTHTHTHTPPSAASAPASLTHTHTHTPSLHQLPRLHTHTTHTHTHVRCISSRVSHTHTHTHRPLLPRLSQTKFSGDTTDSVNCRVPPS